MTHLFRPVDIPDAPVSPSWKKRAMPLAVAGRQLLVTAAGLFSALLQRVHVGPALLFLALLVQGVEILVIGYLVDLALSLFELWADLAQKHLEITL